VDEGLARSRTNPLRKSEANNTEINQQRRSRSNIYDVNRLANSSLSSGKLFDSIHSIPENPNEKGRSTDSTDSSVGREPSLVRGVSILNARVRSGWGEELISIGSSRKVVRKEELEVVLAEHDTGRSHLDVEKTDVSSEVEMLYLCENEVIQMARLDSTLPHAAIATAIDESFSSNHRSSHAVLSSWKTRVDQGIPVENFESVAAKLLKGTMEEFDNDTLSAAGVSGLAAPYRLSIRSKLQEKIEAELKHLFRVHAGLSEMASIQVFNEALMKKNDDHHSGEDRNKALELSRVSDITYSCTDSDDDCKDYEARDEIIDSKASATNTPELRAEEEKNDQDDDKVNEEKGKKKRKQKVKKVTLLKGLQRKELKKNVDKGKGIFFKRTNRNRNHLSKQVQ
jgi:hypothetical protein